MAEFIANEQAQQGNTNDAVDNVGQDDRQGDEEEKNDDTVPVGHGAFENALEGAAFIKPVGQAWLLGQLDGVLGEAGIYNGKERYTPSGNERSFAQTHYAYTLENIVRAMSQTQEERGGQTFGVTAKSMQAVSTPSYGSIAEIKADSGRLGAVEGDA